MLSYADYCDLFSLRCSKCRGDKQIKKDGVLYCCQCQLRATVKWRFEQIDVYPQNLKYKNWSDFTGIIKEGETTVGRLKSSSAIKARDKMLEYCFGDADLSRASDRKKWSIVHKKSSSGSNVIIGGDRSTGKSLLAALLLKEVVWSSAIHKNNLSFKWVKSSDFISAARWDSLKLDGEVIESRPVDHGYLVNLQSINFLAIDGVDIYPNYGRTDIIALDSFFSHRRKRGMPLIIVCSRKFYNMIKNPKFSVDIKNCWGSEFLSMVSSPSNVFIELEREG